MLSNLQKLSNVAKALESTGASFFDFTEQGSSSSSLSLSAQEHLILFGEFINDIRKGHLSESEALSTLERARAIVFEEQNMVSRSCASDPIYDEVGQLWMRNCERLLNGYNELLTYFVSGSESILDGVLSEVHSVFEEKSLLLDRLPPSLRAAPEPRPTAIGSTEIPEPKGLELKTFFSADPERSYEGFLAAIMAALDEPGQSSLEALCHHFDRILDLDHAQVEDRLQGEPTNPIGEIWLEQTAELQESLQELAVCNDSDEREEIFQDLETLTEERISLHLELLDLSR
jgi:hypothetical protein